MNNGDVATQNDIGKLSLTCAISSESTNLSVMCNFKRVYIFQSIVYEFF